MTGMREDLERKLHHQQPRAAAPIPALTPERRRELSDAMARRRDDCLHMFGRDPEPASYLDVLAPLIAQWLADAEESRRTAWAVHAEHVDRMNRLLLHRAAVADEFRARVKAALGAVDDQDGLEGVWEALGARSGRES